MKTTVTETHYDIDGSIITNCETVTLAEGIKALFYTEPGASTPHEIALYIGDDACIEMSYSEEVVSMLGRISEISIVELLKVCNANSWQPKAQVA